MTRIFDKLDSFEKRIDKICDRITRLEGTVRDHFDDIQDSKDRKVLRSTNNERKFYIVIAAMGIGFALYEILR